MIEPGIFFPQGLSYIPTSINNQPLIPKRIPLLQKDL